MKILLQTIVLFAIGLSLSCSKEDIGICNSSATNYEDYLTKNWNIVFDDGFQATLNITKYNPPGFVGATIEAVFRYDGNSATCTGGYFSSSNWGLTGNAHPESNWMPPFALFTFKGGGNCSISGTFEYLDDQSNLMIRHSFTGN